MAQQQLIPVIDDGEILSSSPLIILDTKYYELWMQISGGTSPWSQFIFNSPLPLLTTDSPAGSTPCIELAPLPDNTLYNFKIRRFNSDNIPSDWVTGTFTTGS